ncbi:pentapeptide repeat-containing protein [Streptomyces sp. R41]|uniref:Pentapeptide repeat-containing protein n=1 Tax=Streptomyces sp. R41 TaxID=3238632 RepID=A0AB39RFK9_9ACTN
MVDKRPGWRGRQRGLQLWPVGLVLALAFVAALIVSGGVFWILVQLLGVHDLKSETRLTSQTLFDLVKLSFGVVAGSGALVALVVAYRRQRVDEDGALREATRLHTERFTTAVSQLGEPSAAVRLGGIHALSGLADDAPTKELRQTCIDVLCAYLRLPYTPSPNATDQDSRHNYLALREVRHTAIRLIRDHLRLDAKHPHSWQGHDFDFTNAVFDGGDWSEAQFSGGRVSFNDAIFSGGHVTFYNAQFSGGKVFFHGAKFSGDMVFFNCAQFSGGIVSFDDAQFSGGQVLFSSAQFSAGIVNFTRAQFSGSEVFFNDGQFSGSRVFFHNAQLSGGEVFFHNAQFSGSAVIFHDAQFSGVQVSFNDAQFSAGQVAFTGAEFSGGQVDFQDAQFSGGAVTFNEAQLTGGQVDLRRVSGNAPEGLVPGGGMPLPTGLLLPERWYRPAL